MLLALATVLFTVNFWAVDYQNLTSPVSLWAWFRIVMALFIIILLVSIIRKKRNELPVKLRNEDSSRNESAR